MTISENNMSEQVSGDIFARANKRRRYSSAQHR